MITSSWRWARTAIRQFSPFWHSTHTGVLWAPPTPLSHFFYVPSHFPGEVHFPTHLLGVTALSPNPSACFPSPPPLVAAQAKAAQCAALHHLPIWVATTGEGEEGSACCDQWVGKHIEMAEEGSILWPSVQRWKACTVPIERMCGGCGELRFVSISTSRTFM